MLWDAAKGKMLSRLAWQVSEDRRGPIRAATFSSQGALLASGGHEKIIHVWVVAKALQQKGK